MDIKTFGGLDIGNGYLKGLMCLSDGSQEPTVIDIPSVVGVVTTSHDIVMTDTKIIMDNLFNNLDVSFSTKAIKQNIRCVFGRRGLTSGNATIEFDVHGRQAKSEDDLSSIFVLGIVASHAVKSYYNASGMLPTEQIKVHAKLALAIPIAEYKKHRDSYAKKFLTNTHMVTINNFNSPIFVEVHFDNVAVVPEGGAAQYAINELSEKDIRAMLSVFVSNPMVNPDLKNVTVDDVKNAKNIISVDIGEGTTNIPVFTNGIFNTDVSTTFEKGFGSVIDGAIDNLNDQGFNFTSRKELTEFINTEPSAIMKSRYNRVKAVLEEECVAFAKELKLKINQVFVKSGSAVEVIYVYGGGSIPMAGSLYPEIMNMFAGESKSIDFVVLYVSDGTDLSRILNRNGLFIISRNLK